jgi:hypothetical protein
MAYLSRTNASARPGAPAGVTPGSNTPPASSALATVQTLFRNEGLPFPDLPADLAAQLQELNAHHFATRATGHTLYEFAAHLALASDTDERFLALGFDGHGTNSWAAHFYLVDGPLALLVQVQWGGIYTNSSAATTRMEGVFGFGQALREETEKRQLEPGERLIVCFSDMHPEVSGWRWRSTPDNWQRDGLFTMLAALGALKQKPAANTVDQH